MNDTSTKTKAELEADCLELCLSLSDDKEFKEEIKKATHKERVEFLLKNGFT